ncbi:AraC family transcriptional regulator [Sporolactobacillus shoreicorticis]|uniref:AraC family transcriptional regulator n=1 Tax=Sporolactobacillus shoreicorticis TaxID=1923877 RepID=A0ABW5SA49_9BACL|nr:AraC family transcriptional regulator [Sporolactobacillus shoreicorticis]MCO7127903.1 AraC family transcriptional regulator [Sporolactobacillus shoreicorticis]
MSEKVYIFTLKQPFSYYKAGHYFCNDGWRHKQITNNGDYELFIVLSGEVYIQIGTERFVVKGHDCLLIPPRICHIGYQGSTADTQYYWMHFFPGTAVKTDLQFNTQKLQSEEIAIPQLFQIRNFEKIILLVRQLLDSANDESDSVLTPSYFISVLAIELSNQYIKKTQQKTTSNTATFEMIINWIKIHSHESLSVAQIANEFEITPNYLTRLFKRYQSTTTIAYINQTKVNQAMELLLTTNKTVKQIALELNFLNEKYFMRIFKKTSGTTPSQYRNAFSKTYVNNVDVDPPIPTPKNFGW